MTGYSTKKFDAVKFDFVDLVEALFYTSTCGNLSGVHFLLDEQYTELFEVGKDSATALHYTFYEKLKRGWPKFEYIYETFISDVVSPLFEEDFLYQRWPTIRFHLVSNLAVGAFHTDAEFHHPAGEINFIIPLTNSDGTACPWVESEPGENDFQPMSLRIGHLIKFNGNILRHGNKVNETGDSRASMDFRVLPISKYNPGTTSESITRKTKFIEGGYYKRFTR